MFEPARIQTLWELVEYRARASRGAPMFFDGGARAGDDADGDNADGAPGNGDAAHRAAGQRAVTFDAVTFDEVRDRALRVAAGFHRLGIAKGTRVAWQLPTRVDTVVASLALARLGAVQTPVIPLHREREVGFVLAESRARFLLVPGLWRGFDYGAMARELTRGRAETVRVVDLGAGGLPEADSDAVDATGAALPPFEPRPDATTWVYYTSGTTSSPKGVEHSDATLIAGGVGLATALDISAEEIGSIAFPYAHVAGPDYVIAMLVSGFPAVVLETFAPAAAAAVYARAGVTMAGGSTAFYQAFLDEARRRKPGRERLIPSLRLLSGGGAPLPPELYHDVVRELGCAVVHGYGMTECPMIAMGTPYDSDEQLAHTVGRPVVGARVRIALPDGSEARAGETGEVTLKGPMVFHRYTDPALTAEAFDADGYFRTGDLGHLRPDGHLVLTGRLKDIIIRKGENISAREIEDLLHTHPAVAEAAVIGVPDRERGERVCAVITLARPDAAPPTLAELTGHLRTSGLMVQKLPERLEIVATLPRGGPLDKVLKNVLRERYSTP